MEIAFYGKPKRSSDGLEFGQRDVAEFRRAEAEVAEAEQSVGVVGIDFADEQVALASGVKSLTTGGWSTSFERPLISSWSRIAVVSSSAAFIRRSPDARDEFGDTADMLR